MMNGRGFLFTIAACLVGLLFAGEGLAVQSVLVTRGGQINEVRLGMTKSELITRLGAPSRIKSEGGCFQYDAFDLSLFLNGDGAVNRIYLGRQFKGMVTRDNSEKVSLTDPFKEFGTPVRREGLCYTPSPELASEATVELEDQAREKAPEKAAFPHEYRGDRVLYELYSGDVLLKSKYVLDEEGISFWFDSRQSLYATAIYPPPSAPLAAGDANGARAQTAVVRLEPVNFDFDRSAVRKASLPVLEHHTEYMRAHPQSRLTIEGHTDSSGSEAYNRLLSERRARSVQRYMVQKGIPGSHLRTSGKGESSPVADNRTRGGRAKNRRVEFNATTEK